MNSRLASAKLTSFNAILFIGIREPKAIELHLLIYLRTHILEYFHCPLWVHILLIEICLLPLRSITFVLCTQVIVIVVPVLRSLLYRKLLISCISIAFVLSYCILIAM